MNTINRTIPNATAWALDILPSYIECLIWCSPPIPDENGEDQEADSYDAELSPEDRAKALEMIANFLYLAGPDDLADIPDEMIGHDIALTQNHHGAGFWDRNYGEKGKRLTEHAHSLGSWQCVGITPDGKHYYVEG